MKNINRTQNNSKSKTYSKQLKAHPEDENLHRNFPPNLTKACT